MDVSMEEVRRFILLDQRLKAFKTLVALVLPVVNMAGWSVRDNNIYAAASAEVTFKAAHYPSHLFFRVLMGTPIVPSAALESKDIDAVELNNLCVYVKTSIRSDTIYPDIVIALHNIEGRIKGAA